MDYKEIPDLTPENLQRFYSKISKDNNSNCWLWIGKTDRNKYGWFSKNNQWYSAHRIAYMLKFGDIDSSLTIDHLCHNRSCVNPDHLEQISLQENIQRGGNSLKTHCPRGHKYDKIKDGRRVCSFCERKISREYIRKWRHNKQLIEELNTCGNDDYHDSTAKNHH